MKKNIKQFALFLTVILSLTACSSEEDIDTTTNELEGYTLFQNIANDFHTIELYTTSTTGLQQGYNNIIVQIKNKSTNEYETDASVSWSPVMHMTTMMHSCPKSALSKISTEGNAYKGYIAFQMAENFEEYWELTFTYSINGNTYTATDKISVPASEKRRITTFTGTDNVKYIMAYIEPKNPAVALNDLTIGVWKMENMMSFPVVDGYTVKIDPRMPSMGNHSSPNNVNATQMEANGLYYGKLSLTMTGYWKINLQLANQTGDILKGEEITDTVEASSIYFEIEY